ncbi:hypothetical protein [Lysinibacillus sp. NPDC096212]|uniref:hypothetical protein n=1 Tax=unclassified Lysinibacillus TaxID=2636778 RepID=UPI00381658F8
MNVDVLEMRMISIPTYRFTTGAIHDAIGGSHVVISDSWHFISGFLDFISDSRHFISGFLDFISDSRHFYQRLAFWSIGRPLESAQPERKSTPRFAGEPYFI